MIAAATVSLATDFAHGHQAPVALYHMLKVSSAISAQSKGQLLLL